MKPLAMFITTICLTNTATSTAASESGIDGAFRVRSANIEFNGNIGESITAKARLNAGHAINERLFTFLQVDHVEDFLEENHSTVLLVNDNPLITDTPGTELNQAFFRYQLEEQSLTLGRQALTFGSERFIGDIDFWQNDQTFDGVLFSADLFSASNIKYAYVNNVNRIFGDEADETLDRRDIRFDALNGQRPAAELGNHRLDGNFLHLELKEWDYVEFSAYGYTIHNFDFPEASNRTFGASGNFRYKPGSVKYTGTLEYAAQKKQQSAVDEWIPYYLAEFGLGWQKLDVSMRWEVLDDREGESFDTPLASRHEFQGWADQFLITPVGGVEDRSLRINWTPRPWQLDLRYHQFRSAADNNRVFGDEVDLDLIFRPTREHEIKLRYANFRPEPNQTITPDRVKALFISYSYNL